MFGKGMLQREEVKCLVSYSLAGIPLHIVNGISCLFCSERPNSDGLEV